MSEPELTKEERILRSVKGIITQVIKETATPPGMAHPLSEDTIRDMRECLLLISNREQELADEHGRDTSMRPRFRDEPRQADEAVVVPLHKSGLGPESSE